MSSADVASAAPATEAAPGATAPNDLFISYSRRDRVFTERLAASLAELGWSVWWDHRISAGEAFDRTIEDAITAARLVLVVWSRHSVASDWVRAEAAFALASNKLLPVSIDSTAPPLRFTHVHRIDLSGWDGSDDDRRFKRLAADIAARLGDAAPGSDRTATVARAETEAATSKLPSSARKAVLAAAIGAVTAGALALAWIAMPPKIPPKEPAMIGSPVPFPEGQVTLSASARTAIGEQAAFLRQHPGLSVTVKASCTPREGERFGPGVLAVLRANKVRNELIDAGGVAADRVAVAGAAKACDARAGLAVVLQN